MPQAHQCDCEVRLLLPKHSEWSPHRPHALSVRSVTHSARILLQAAADSVMKRQQCCQSNHMLDLATRVVESMATTLSDPSPFLTAHDGACFIIVSSSGLGSVKTCLEERIIRDPFSGNTCASNTMQWKKFCYRESPCGTAWSQVYTIHI